MAGAGKEPMAAMNERAGKINKQVVRALVIPMRREVRKASPLVDDSAIDTGEELPGGGSKAVTEDPFHNLAGGGDIVEPPFDLLTLATLPEYNTELTPVIETYETNIDGFGHLLVPRIDTAKLPEGDPLHAKVRHEFVELTNFFNYANMRDSFTELRRKTRFDRETTGNAYLEVIRNAAGEIQGLEHIPSYQVRLTSIEPDPVKVKVPVLLLQDDGSFQLDDVDTWQRFRKFVQARLTPFRGMNARGGYKMRYFKEFGDPRTYDNETGKLVPPSKIAGMKDWRKANELIHFRIYSPRSPYGVPRFIGNLLSIFGARASEEINYVTLRNNNIPSMMVLVSNGQLTQGTIDRMNSFVESEIQGSDNYSKFLIVEAEGDEEGEDAGNVKIDVKPLTSSQLKDAMFQQYGKNNAANVRRAFRVPPIFVGGTDDYTRSTADTSRRLADEQVFAPERDEFDGFMNRRFLPAMGVIYHRFKSNSPNTTDNTELVQILSGAEKTGGMTPRIARLVIRDILGIELPPFPEGIEGFNPDVPFSLSMAEAVKNQADPAEPGQQLTALKALRALGILSEDETKPGDPGEAQARHVMRLRRELEKKWEEAVAGLEIEPEGR